MRNREASRILDIGATSGAGRSIHRRGSLTDSLWNKRPKAAFPSQAGAPHRPWAGRAERLGESPMAKSKAGGKWSAKVNETSDALELQPHVFEADDPKEIAASLKRSAEHSRRRKATPYQSAMSMLTFYINRAGKNLTAERKHTLQEAKDELRKQFGRSKA
jgi:hypothetical protein